jgi:hypothetical protein
MEGNNNNNLIDKYGSWTSVIIALLTFAYFGVVKGNTAENEISALKQWKLEANIRMDGLEAKKVDKETFIILMTGQNEIKTLLINHILKTDNKQ